MLFAGLVVEEDAFLQRFMDNLVGDLVRVPIFLIARSGDSPAGRDFQNVVGAAGVAAGVARDFFRTSSEAADLKCPARVRVGEGPLKQHHDLIFGERLQHVDAAAREERGDDFKGRIFGGRADQADIALLHIGKKSVLLRFVEAMNFVNEDDGPRAVLARALGVGHDLLDS